MTINSAYSITDLNKDKWSFSYHSLILISWPWQSKSRWWFITSEGCTNPPRWLWSGSWWAKGPPISAITIKLRPGRCIQNICLDIRCKSHLSIQRGSSFPNRTQLFLFAHHFERNSSTILLLFFSTHCTFYQTLTLNCDILNRNRPNLQKALLLLLLLKHFKVHTLNCISIQMPNPVLREDVVSLILNVPGWYCYFYPGVSALIKKSPGCHHEPNSPPFNTWSNDLFTCLRAHIGP